MKIILTIVLMAILSSCAYPVLTDNFVAEKIPKGKAIVYIYRPQQLDIDHPASFYVNDQFIGKVAIGGYYKVIVDPGTIVFSKREHFLGIPLWKENVSTVTLKENDTFYLRYGLGQAIWKKPLTPEEMAEEIKTTQLLVPQKID